jgi:hypothetical protein
LSDQPPPADAEERAMQRSSLLALIIALGLSTAAPAATSAGKYKGKIDYQGYDITFKIKGNKITDVVARMLADCDRDGYSEEFLIAPDATWTIKNGKFSGKKVQSYGQSKAYVTFKGTVKGSTVKGFIREWDTVEGSGVVCDTLKRTFTAKRS